jgi:hypothetical protein
MKFFASSINTNISLTSVQLFGSQKSGFFHRKNGFFGPRSTLENIENMPLFGIFCPPDGIQKVDYQ